MMVAAGTQSSIVLLDRGEVAFARMLAAIRGATRSIHLETYAMSTTGVGGDFLTALADAARRGVRVQVVVDAWGTGRVAGGIVARLRAAGCQADVYNPLWRGLFGRRRRRNHRKLLVVDDRVAFAGGINLVDDFVGAHAWADVAVEIHGAACANLGRRLRHEPQREPDSAVHVLLSGGGGRRLRRRYLHAIGSARHRILLAQSYFLPDHGLLRSLTAAARRGVAVTLLVPGVSDVPLARATTALVYQRLLAAGVQVFELSATILHSSTRATPRSPRAPRHGSSAISRPPAASSTRGPTAASSDASPSGSKASWGSGWRARSGVCSPQRSESALHDLDERAGRSP